MKERNTVTERKRLTVQMLTDQLCADKDPVIFVIPTKLSIPSYP